MTLAIAVAKNKDSQLVQSPGKIRSMADGKPIQVVIHSANEGIESGGAAFWSNEDGWVCLSEATIFSVDEIDSLNRPLSNGMDANWVTLLEAIQTAGTLPESLGYDAALSRCITMPSDGDSVRLVHILQPDMGELQLYTSEASTFCPASYPKANTFIFDAGTKDGSVYKHYFFPHVKRHRLACEQ